MPAIAADFALWLLMDVMTSSEGVPEGYHPTDPVTLTLLCFSLLVIYGGSIGIRSLGLRHRISIFEIGQGVLAFILVSVLALRASHGSAAPVLGALFLLLAAVCYSGALSRFVEEAQTRNRRVYVTWATALLLAGTFFLFPANLRVLFLCVAALATVLAYTRKLEFSLGLHASIYLAAATAVSSLPMYAGNALAGTVPAAGGLVRLDRGSFGGALLRDTFARPRRSMEPAAACVVPVVLVGFAAAALVVGAIVRLADGRMELNASRLAVIRTIVNCSLALALGFLGSRWKHAELGWVAYAAVGFGTLKLLFEDLRFGNAASLVVSFLFYGMILILLPRFTRRGQTQS